MLACAAGRDVELSDAFRIGGKFAAGKTRPILVKLRSIWDRRLFLNGTRKLSDEAEYKRRVYISSDESFDTRHRNTLERLKARTNHESKVVEVSVN